MAAGRPAVCNPVCIGARVGLARGWGGPGLTLWSEMCSRSSHFSRARERRFYGLFRMGVDRRATLLPDRPIWRSPSQIEASSRQGRTAHPFARSLGGPKINNGWRRTRKRMGLEKMAGGEKRLRWRGSDGKSLGIGTAGQVGTGGVTTLPRRHYVAVFSFFIRAYSNRIG